MRLILCVWDRGNKFILGLNHHREKKCVKVHVKNKFGRGGGKTLRYSHMKNANSSSSTLISNTRQKWTDGKAWRYGQLFSMDKSQCKYSEGCISMWYSTCSYYNRILKCKRKKCRDDTVFRTYTCQCLSLPEIHSIFFLHCYLLLPFSLSSLTVIHCCISTSINTLGNKELTLLCHEKASSVYVKHLRSETIMRHECFCICCKREMWNDCPSWNSAIALIKQDKCENLQV